MIKWKRSNKDYPEILNEPVYTKDMDNNIRIMKLVFSPVSHEGSYTSMFFKDRYSGPGFMHWRELNSDYECRYSHVISWSYVKDCPNPEEFYPIFKFK